MIFWRQRLDDKREADRMRYNFRRWMAGIIDGSDGGIHDHITSVCGISYDSTGY